jgi:hypothetical protein
MVGVDKRISPLFPAEVSVNGPYITSVDQKLITISLDDHDGVATYYVRFSSYAYVSFLCKMAGLLLVTSPKRMKISAAHGSLFVKAFQWKPLLFMSVN